MNVPNSSRVLSAANLVSIQTACLLDHAQVAARQFANPAILATLDRIRMNQVPANPKSYCTRANEIRRVFLIDAAGSNQSDLREGRFERSYITWAAKLGTGKDLDEVRPGLRCG